MGYGNFNTGPLTKAIYFFGGVIGILVLIGIVVHSALTKPANGTSHTGYGLGGIIPGLAIIVGVLAILIVLERRRQP